MINPINPIYEGFKKSFIPVPPKILFKVINEYKDNANSANSANNCNEINDIELKV